MNPARATARALGVLVVALLVTTLFPGVASAAIPPAPTNLTRPAGTGR